MIYVLHLMLCIVITFLLNHYVFKPVSYIPACSAIISLRGIFHIFTGPIFYCGYYMNILLITTATNLFGITEYRNVFSVSLIAASTMFGIFWLNSHFEIMDSLELDRRIKRVYYILMIVVFPVLSFI